ncbi:MULTISPECIES: hypothetical protein [unclassified Mesorhizobium]|uniref:hypothetical protein n=1 Tax=unclassified Mesorhizobium TaxID=325217 RepID=UPI001D00B458|nr:MULTISPECIES: hypothetical protein [unclassified Mesorhizobium]UCI16184.1 hypothetical protein FJ972_17595 [Mesorhizobium sp. B2-1-1]
MLARQFDSIAKQHGVIDNDALFAKRPGERVSHFSFVLDQQNPHCTSTSRRCLVIRQDYSSIANNSRSPDGCVRSFP